MTNLIKKCNTSIYKFIAFIIFIVGIFAVNSACNLIFYQNEESECLKRFGK